MDTKPPLLSVQNLSVSFDSGGRRVQAVRDLSFDIHEGEVLGLVGESGSGKTVTGMSLIRLVPRPPGRYESGQIWFEGRDVLRLAPSELRTLRGSRISAIFQEPMTALSPLKTVGDQLLELVTLHRPQDSRRAARDLVIDWLEKVGIPDPARRMNAFPFQFSGGMRQRVMIAMALMMEPRLIIADEPTTALDVTLQAQVFELMMRMKADKTSLLFITHDMGVVWELCDRVLVMQNARLVESGPVDKVFDSPREPYTRALLSAVPRLTDPMVRESFQSDQAPLLRTQDLKTWFRVRRGFFGHGEPIRALDGVDLEIFPGQTVGLVGESGSGKSTLGRTLLGLETATGGEAWYRGQSLRGLNSTAWRPIRRRLQMVFQDPYSSLNSRMTIEDLLTEAPRVHGVLDQPAPDFAAFWLREVGLDPDMRLRYPHEFSGGQRQRICIARALALQPELIVLDEAVSALDVTIQAQILDLLIELRERHNLAYLFISHDLSVVKRIADHLLVMRHGRIVESGHPARVVENPQQDYTRSLLAAVPVPGDTRRRWHARPPIIGSPPESPLR